MTLFVLLDGAEDHPIPEFGGKTPLETADMPFIRSARCAGRTEGRGYTHLFLNELFTGHPPAAPRAAIEALGLGMDMGSGRTAYRLSPACIRNGRIRWIYDLDSIYEKLIESAGRHMHMLEHMEPEIDFFLNGRAILTMRCDDAPDLPSPPSETGMVEVPGDLGRFVTAISEELNGFTAYPWGCGRIPENSHVPYVSGMTAVSNSPTALGISRSLGYETRYVKNIEERFETAEELLRTGDVFLHLDEIDEYSHQRDPEKKVKILEYCDRMLSEHFGGDDIAMFVDHGTSSVTGEHILMDVPFWTSFDVGTEMIPLSEFIPAIMRCRNGKR